MNPERVKAAADELKFLETLTIDAANGNAKTDVTSLIGKRIVSVRPDGRRLMIGLEEHGLIVYFPKYGTYRVNARKEATPSLSISTRGGEANFYYSWVRIFPKELLMRPDSFAGAGLFELAKRELTKEAKAMAASEKVIGELLRDWTVFPGMDNIKKNEVLWRASIHPESISKNIPSVARGALLEEIDRIRAWADRLRREGKERGTKWVAHRRRRCLRCFCQMTKTGEKQAAHFYCAACQIRF